MSSKVTAIAESLVKLATDLAVQEQIMKADRYVIIDCNFQVEASGTYAECVGHIERLHKGDWVDTCSHLQHTVVTVQQPVSRKPIAVYHLYKGGKA